MDSKFYVGMLLAIAAAIFWGISGTSGQYLFENRHINVEWLITVRLLISGSILLFYAQFVRKQNIFFIWRNLKDISQLLVFSIIGMLAVQYTYFAAIKNSNAATATVLQYSGPVIIALYLAIRNRKIPGLREIAAITLAVVGTFLLVTHGNFHTLAISRAALILGLLSAVALAIYTLQPAGLLSKFNPIIVIGWAMLCGGMIFSIVKAPWIVKGTFDQYTYLHLILIILLGTLIAFTFYLYSVKIIGGQKASLLASAEPLAAAIISVYWLKTPFTAIDWIGTLCIISTVFLLTKSEEKDKFTLNQL
jgi:drug/metabolite transporter (DMT)-like permease